MFLDKTLSVIYISRIQKPTPLTIKLSYEGLEQENGRTAAASPFRIIRSTMADDNRSTLLRQELEKRILVLDHGNHVAVLRPGGEGLPERLL